MRKRSHTALKVYERCPKAYEYKYVDGLRLRERAEHFDQGSRLHHGLELYHTDPVEFVEWLGSATPNDRDILERYADKWDGEEWEVIDSEADLEFTIGPHTVVFKPDLIIRINDEVWIVDHKTTKNIPDEWDPYNMTDFQHLLYIAGLRQLHPEWKVKGFIFNYLRTKPPTQPKLIKDGSRVADVRRLDTTPEHIEALLKHAGIEDPSAREKIQILRASPDKFFQRHFLIVTDEAVNAAVRSARATFDEIVNRETGRVATKEWPRNVMAGYAGSASCARCDYQPVCHTDMMGYDSTDLTIQLYSTREERHAQANA